MDAEEPVPGAGQPAVGDEPAPEFTSESAPGGEDPPLNDDASPKKTSRRQVIGAGVAVVVVGGVAAGVALSRSSGPTTISTGTGTATITWTPATGPTPVVGNLPQPFSGTVDGLQAKGVATTTFSAADADSLSGSKSRGFQVFEWKGTMGGKPFDLGVFIQPVKTGPSGGYLALGAGEFKVVGKYGSDAVSAVVVGPIAIGNPTTARFRGTVGHMQVSGAISGPNGNSQKQVAKATLTVTK
jgi:hypothetical protein